MEKKIFTDAVVGVIKELDERGFRDLYNNKVVIDFDKMATDYRNYVQEMVELAVRGIEDIDTANEITEIDSEEVIWDMADYDDALCNWYPSEIDNVHDDVDREDKYYLMVNEGARIAEGFDYLDDYLVNYHFDAIIEYYELDAYEKAKQHIIDNIDSYVTTNEEIVIKVK